MIGFQAKIGSESQGLLMYNFPKNSSFFFRIRYEVFGLWGLKLC